MTNRPKMRILSTLPLFAVLLSTACSQLGGSGSGSPTAPSGPLPAADPNRYAALRTLLATPQPPGANFVIVSHGNPFYGVAGPPYLAEGEGAVVRGLGRNNFEIVARIRLVDWPALVAAR